MLDWRVSFLKEHGLSKPVLGFTDAIVQDIETFCACMLSLGEAVNLVQLDQFSDLPLLSITFFFFFYIQFILLCGGPYIRE
jgi:hypothetical protein